MSLLPEADVRYLEGLGHEWTETLEHGHVCVVVKDWHLPPGYRPEAVDLLVRLPPGYPDTAPDMVWWRPDVVVASTGQPPPASDVRETYLELSWQRLSRHLDAGAWVSGTDTLESFLAVIRKDLHLEQQEAA
jgi:hypothetical protein